MKSSVMLLLCFHTGAAGFRLQMGGRQISRHDILYGVYRHHFLLAWATASGKLGVCVVSALC